MSVEAICWALNLAPAPADRGGQPSSACKFVLGLLHPIRMNPVEEQDGWTESFGIGCLTRPP